MFHRMMNYGDSDARPTVVLTKDLIKKSIPKFRRHDDLLVIQEKAWEEFKKSLPIPVVPDENSPFSIDEDELASLVCQSVQKPACSRLAIERGVKNDELRSPNVELILGENGIVRHKDNSILYQFDVTKCMFSFGNVKEKMRMAELDCREEIVVDLFAGIGYFTLPLLIHAKAKHLYACEWNPNAIDALRKNLVLNKIDASRCTVIEGDNRSNRPSNVAQRVILGILPSSFDWMKTAFECIDKRTGAVLHCHDLIEYAPSTNKLNQVSAGTATATAMDRNSFIESLDASLPANNPQSIDSQSLLNHSLNSSTSSHSTIEKLTAPSADDKILQSGDSDKDTSSPVLLEKPSGSSGAGSVLDSSNEVSNETASYHSSCHEDGVSDSVGAIADSGVINSRGAALIARLKDELKDHKLSAKVLHVQRVKSYAPHIVHVVFDILIEPQNVALN